MGFRARLEDGRRLGTGWDALFDRLTRLDRTTWHDLHSWREFRDGCGETMALQAWKHERRLICTEVHVAPDAGLLLCTRR